MVDLFRLKRAAFMSVMRQCWWLLGGTTPSARCPTVSAWCGNYLTALFASSGLLTSWSRLYPPLMSTQALWIAQIAPVPTSPGLMITCWFISLQQFWLGQTKKVQKFKSQKNFVSNKGKKLELRKYCNINDWW